MSAEDELSNLKAWRKKLLLVWWYPADTSVPLARRRHREQTVTVVGILVALHCISIVSFSIFVLKYDDKLNG